MYARRRGRQEHCGMLAGICIRNATVNPRVPAGLPPTSSASGAHLPPGRVPLRGPRQGVTRLSERRSITAGGVQPSPCWSPATPPSNPKVALRLTGLSRPRTRGTRRRLGQARQCRRVASDGAETGRSSTSDVTPRHRRTFLTRITQEAHLSVAVEEDDAWARRRRSGDCCREALGLLASQQTHVCRDAKRLEAQSGFVRSSGSFRIQIQRGFLRHLSRPKRRDGLPSFGRRSYEPHALQLRRVSANASANVANVANVVNVVDTPAAAAIISPVSGLGGGVHGVR